MMFSIPEEFANFMVDLFGEEGRAWVGRLPAILARCEEQWGMKLGEPVKNLSYNYVAPGTLADGREVMLKTGLTDEFPAQPEALRHFNGQGSVQLLAYDEQNAAMLMERLRPGESLRTIEDDEVAISIAAGVMRKLWRPLSSEERERGHFPTIQDWGKAFARMRNLYDGRTGPIPVGLFDRGERLYEELSKSMTEVVLLHGDLHQDNILASERESWLAVDPKGVIGEPAYETGSILRNFWPDILKVSDPRALMARRIDQFVDELGFERERVYGWAFAQAVLSVVWSIEDTGRLEDDGLFFVEALKKSGG